MNQAMVQEQFSDNLQLQEIGLIDTHAHRIHPRRGAGDLTYAVGYLPGEHQRCHAEHTLLYDLLSEKLRIQYGLPANASKEEIRAERDRLLNRDFAAYTRELLQNVGVDVYLMENGSPLNSPLYSAEETAFFDSMIPRKQQRNMVRIERVLEGILLTELPDTFEKLQARYELLLEAELSNPETVAIKSCIAYYGGLDVNPVSEKMAAKSYEAIRERLAKCKQPRKIADLVIDEKSKDFYQYFLFYTAHIANRFDVPIQIHTGQGAMKYIDVRTTNPIHLIDFLTHEDVLNKVRIVLLHGGNSFEEETGNLVLQFENVYSDFSGAIWSTAANAKQRLRGLLERAPLDKIMYGSDANVVPELYFFSPIRFREVLNGLMKDYVDEGVIGKERAREYAKLIMRENALQCYSRI